MNNEREGNIQTYNYIDPNQAAEEAWKEASPQVLKWAPSAEELRQRWYRHRFTKFVSNEFKCMKQDPPRPLGSEEIFFSLYPYLKEKWLQNKKKSEVGEPTSSLLLDRWFKQRRFEFKKNWLKKNTSGDKYNVVHQKYVSAHKNSLCGYRPRMFRALFWMNDLAIIVILILLAIVLWKRNFKFF